MRERVRRDIPARDADAAARSKSPFALFQRATPDQLLRTEVLERVLSYIESIAEERGIGLEMTAADGANEGCEVRADEDMLVRALRNLISNALRHAAPGSRIELRAHADPGGGCLIDVSNGGPPVRVVVQTRILERFNRGDASRENSSSSSGLGLAIARSIMHLHHGTVTVSSAPGEKTILTLAFPANAATDEAPSCAGFRPDPSREQASASFDVEPIDALETSR